MRSIQGRFVSVILVFLALTVTIVVATLYVAKSQEADTIAIDLAGQQRMLPVKMTEESLALIGLLESESSSDAAKRTLQATRDQFERNHALLLNGGNFESGGKSVVLPGASPTFRIALDKIGAAWAEQRTHIDFLLQAKVDVASDHFFSAVTFLKKNKATLVDLAGSAVPELRDESYQKVVFLKTLLLAALAITLVTGMLAWFVGRRYVVLPIQDLAMQIGYVAHSRDLTREIPVVSQDEVGTASQAFNSLISSLADILGDVIETTRHVSSTADRFKDAAEREAAGARNQSEAATTVSAAIEQMSVSICSVADRAAEALRVAEEANKATTTGAAIVQRATDEVSAISTSIESLSKMIVTLDNRSQDISGIVSVIKEIADQTNLLALNAAIEAARAGEQGRGFAVVADEVRKLAEGTQKATLEIAAKIEAIRTETGVAVREMEVSTARVGIGVELTSDAANALKEIGGSVSSVLQCIHEIADATQEQSAAGTEVARNVERIAQMTEETSKAAGETANHAINMDSVARQLADSVAKFKVR